VDGAQARQYHQPWTLEQNWNTLARRCILFQHVRPYGQPVNLPRVVLRREMQQSAPYDARAVANLLLDLADERRVSLTQMSVLKIIYFAHGWYLATKDRPLCSQPFEAWEHGPVVKVVRDAFKDSKKAYINKRATRLILNTGEFVEVVPEFTADDRSFVTNIFDAYYVYDAWQLSDITHEHGSPWDLLWNAHQPFGRLALRIKDEDIQAHFRSLRHRFALS